MPPKPASESQLPPNLPLFTLRINSGVKSGMSNNFVDLFATQRPGSPMPPTERWGLESYLYSVVIYHTKNYALTGS